MLSKKHLKKSILIYIVNNMDNIENKTPKNILNSISKYQKGNGKDKVNEKMRRYYEKHAKMKARQKLWRETKLKQLKNENAIIEQ
jgi:trans-aconitate methyltransferase